MSAPRGKRRRTPPAAAARPATAARRTSRAPWLLLLAAVVAGGAFVAWRATQRPRLPAATVVVDSLATMPAADAYLTALQLMQSRQYAASLPYFRRARQGAREDFGQLHCNYAGALYNTVFVVDTLGGVSRPFYPTSAARVAVMRECLDEFLTARRLAKNPEESAFYANRLARVLRAWGFAWEAFSWYRESARLQPRNTLYRSQAQGMQNIMSEPLYRPGEQPDSL